MIGTLIQLYNVLGIVHRTPAAYRVQSQGIMERYNSTFVNMLRCYVKEDEKDWNKYIKLVKLAYNAGTHA